MSEPTYARLDRVAGLSGWQAALGQSAVEIDQLKAQLTAATTEQETMYDEYCFSVNVLLDLAEGETASGPTHTRRATIWKPIREGQYATITRGENEGQFTIEHYVDPFGDTPSRLRSQIAALKARAEAAEQALQLVREVCDQGEGWTAPAFLRDLRAALGAVDTPAPMDRVFDFDLDDELAEEVKFRTAPAELIEDENVPANVTAIVGDFSQFGAVDTPTDEPAKLDSSP